MNKTEFINAVSEKSGLSKTDSKKAVEAFFETIAEELKAGGKVALLGFGSFSVIEKAARQGINPRTKEYFALFHGVYDCEKRQHDIIKALGITAWGQDGTHSINLKISNKSAFLESENGKRIYEFENPDHILFLAEHSYCLKQRMSVNGYSLLQSYYGK